MLPKNCPGRAYRCLKGRWCKRRAQKECGNPKVGPDMGAAKRAGIGSMIPGGSSGIPASSFVPIVGHEHPGH